MIIPEHHLADCRSKKRICLYDTDDIEHIQAKTCDHSMHDSFDCYCVFQYRIIRAIRLYGKDSSEQKMMETMANFHFAKMSPEFISKEMASLSFITSIDIGKHGESLCKPFFRE